MGDTSIYGKFDGVEAYVQRDPYFLWTKCNLFGAPTPIHVSFEVFLNPMKMG